MVKILFLTWVCFLFTSSPVVSQQLEFYYDNFHGGNTSLNLSDGAEIEKNGMLRLTNQTSRLKGHAFYPFPVKFKSSNDSEVFSFSTAFAFAIVPEYRELGGHGFAFTISQSEDFSQARPSQYLGLLNDKDNGNFTNHVFAVEFDTVKDFEFGDINDNHIGIDINSMVSNTSVPAAYFINNGSGLTKKSLHLQSGKTIQAWIDYDSDGKELNVTLSLSSNKPVLSLLTYQLDLSRILKENMYVGFSASTGLLASSHYVFGWSFNMSGIARSLDLSSLPSLSGHGKNRTGLIVGLSVLFVILVLVSVGIAAYLVRRKKNADVVEDWELDIGPRRFSYQDLKTATNGFKESELLGFGGFGRVYKGVLKDSSTEVAVKRISHESRQGLREFACEITTIGRLRHKNLVQLLGWCRRKEDLLIVYEFMPNGSLDKYLFDEPKKILSWEQRFKIITGAASGLLYLHEEWEQTVIHRDIKAGNVLLDSELNGRLGDFGLAKLYEHGSNPSSTRVVGTLGYLAPELTRTGKPTTASDVFAFGAVLLEVVCGRRPIEPKALPEELVLVDWVWEKLSEQSILGVVDKRLNGEYDEVEVVMVLKLGLMCSNNAPQVRPTMRQVVRYLEGDIILPEVLAQPDACEMINGDNSGSHSTVFEDFMNSYPSSSCSKKASTWFERDAEAEASSTLSLSGSAGGR